MRFCPVQRDRRLLRLGLTDAGPLALLAAEGQFNSWLVGMTADLRD